VHDRRTVHEVRQRADEHLVADLEEDERRQEEQEVAVDGGAVLRGEAKTASIFPNSSDIGMSREKIFAEFLRLHAPSKCNVVFGGFLFGDDGSESGQLDVLITTDTTPQFNFNVS